MKQQRLPHFIIIGAMKSATTTLQEQLCEQPGIFMCDPKEPNFFSDDEQYRKGMSWYADLFAGAPADALLGEASTHYTKLPLHPDSIGRMHRQLPQAKLIYVMRHPVDRLVSHYIHEWSMGNCSCGIDEAVERHPEMVAYGKYAMQLDRVFEAYGRNAVLPVFFDRLLKHPQSELERVCRFIGYAGQPQWVSELKASNVSSERVRRFPLYGMLVDSAPATWLRRSLVPQAWRDWVKGRLTMRERPVLSPEVRAALEHEFDRDLARLGAWLGTPLSCADFRSVTAANVFDWTDERVVA